MQLEVVKLTFDQSVKFTNTKAIGPSTSSIEALLRRL